MLNRKFVITIDTEADNLWARPRFVTTANLKALPRFQAICEQYGYLPTYLISYEVCCDSEFVSMLKRWRRMRLCEIGAHPHAWLCPPEYDLTGADFYYQPLLIEYPSEIIASKISFISRYLADRFETDIRSHRAGRWGVNQFYLNILWRNGFTHDSSITPHMRWILTSPDGVRKSILDYRNALEDPHYALLEKIDFIKPNTLIEVPVTIRPKRTFKNRLKKIISKVSSGNIFKSYDCIWLRPNGKNLNEIISLVQDDTIEVLVFTLHSSEMIAGGSPYFADNESVEVLFEQIKVIFEMSKKNDIVSAFLSDIKVNAFI